MRTVFVMLLALFGLASSALASHECETSCSAYCRDQVDRWSFIIDSHRDYCDGGGTDCIPHCVDRYNDGSCRDYGPDFCARNPVCVPKATDRYNDGSVRDYAADHCGSGPRQCVAQCNSRYADGTCRDYGGDFCGRNASCRAQCTDRWPDGSCRAYGTDACTASPEP